MRWQSGADSCRSPRGAANEQLQSELRALSTEEIGVVFSTSPISQMLFVNNRPSSSFFRGSNGVMRLRSRANTRGATLSDACNGRDRAGQSRPPEAVDAIGTISGLLSELVRRSTGTSS